MQIASRATQIFFKKLRLELTNLTVNIYKEKKRKATGQKEDSIGHSCRHRVSLYPLSVFSGSGELFFEF
jgi:hypothetical protein